MLKDVPDARYSGFYRKSDTIYSEKYMRENWNVSEFMPTYFSPRVSETGRKKAVSEEINQEEEEEEGILGITQKERNDPHKWHWGVNMRDKLKDNTQDIGLVTFPGFMWEELLVCKSLTRQLSPLKTPRLTEKGEKDIEDMANPILDAFNNQVKRITKERTNMMESIETVNVIFRGQEFFSGKIVSERLVKKTRMVEIHSTLIRDGILNDLKLAENVTDCQAHLEVMTDTIYNVRLEVTVSPIPNRGEQRATKRSKKQKHK